MKTMQEDLNEAVICGIISEWTYDFFLEYYRQLLLENINLN